VVALEASMENSYLKELQWDGVNQPVYPGSHYHLFISKGRLAFFAEPCIGMQYRVQTTDLPETYIITCIAAKVKCCRKNVSHHQSPSSLQTDIKVRLPSGVHD